MFIINFHLSYRQKKTKAKQKQNKKTQNYIGNEFYPKNKRKERKIIKLFEWMSIDGGD